MGINYGQSIRFHCNRNLFDEIVRECTVNWKEGGGDWFVGKNLIYKDGEEPDDIYFGAIFSIHYPDIYIGGRLFRNNTERARESLSERIDCDITTCTDYASCDAGNPETHVVEYKDHKKWRWRTETCNFLIDEYHILFSDEVNNGAPYLLYPELPENCIIASEWKYFEDDPEKEIKE